MRTHFSSFCTPDRRTNPPPPQACPHINSRPLLPIAAAVTVATQVSEPAGATLAPEKNAVLVGCRGFACLQLTVGTFEADDKDVTSRSSSSSDGAAAKHNRNSTGSQATRRRDRRRSCAEFGGPLIDPARVLANIVASLHDPATGELRVQGLSSPSAGALSSELEALAQGLRGLRYGEREVRSEAGYSPPPVACAKEVRVFLLFFRRHVTWLGVLVFD